MRMPDDKSSFEFRVVRLRPCNRRNNRTTTRKCPGKLLLLFLGVVQLSCLYIGPAAGFSENFSKLKTAEELGVPACTDDSDCVYGGVCVRDKNSDANRCYCSSSCPLSVPVQCAESNDYSCMNMGYTYTSKYDLRRPMCYHKRCICPPAFDLNMLQPPIPGFSATLPMKCDRRELQALIVASPSASVYKGTETNIYCCVNVDPRFFLPYNGVYFVQNGTRKIEPTTTPYENFSRDIDTLFTVPTCWILHVSNAQLSDSGAYACIVQPAGTKYYPVLNVSMELVVKNSPDTKPYLLHMSSREQATVLTSAIHDKLAAAAAEFEQNKTPDVIENLRIEENSTSATVVWSTLHEDHHMNIDFALFDRYVKAKEVWRRANVSSPVTIEGLQPGTPYTLFITIRDGQLPGIPFSRQFSTKPTTPDPPPLDAIRLVSGESGGGQLCEIEWRPAHREREFITRYYVKISGRLRYISPELHSELAALEDHPPGAESCVNYYRDADKYINATTFHKRFLACKYGPLKPNRNYSASVWVENEAGRSRPAVFESQCVTDFAEPDIIEPPLPLTNVNMSSFQLEFNARPDETNGPIVCYYLAIVPLPINVSVKSLPSPELIIMDNFDKALQNNLQPFAIANNRFFAYIAESYMQYPQLTTVGDGNVSGGAERCSVLYLARHKPLDPALTPNLKYTGFLIARVDRDRSLQVENAARILTGSGGAKSLNVAAGGLVPRVLSGRGGSSRPTSHSFTPVSMLSGRRPRRDVNMVIPLSAAATNFNKNENDKNNNNENEMNRGAQVAQIRRRQLANVDPAYGFSEYFEPVVLQEGTAGVSWLLLLFIFLFVFLALLFIIGAFYIFRNKWGKLLTLRTSAAQVFSRLRWHSKHDLLKTAPPQPIKVDELANEYVMRHRDSNFHFTQEFELLPRGKDLDHTISERNARKNRYNDIKACDSTRVRLRKISGDQNSDYINANFIKGYKSRKVFIASQGPLENTVDDFWRMIWEQGSRIIIMVTNLRERCREQCVKYWPDEDRNPLVFRNLEVRSLKSTYFAEYALREFEVSEFDYNAAISGYGSGHFGNGSVRGVSAAGNSSSGQPTGDHRSPSSLSDITQHNATSRPSSAMRESSSGPFSLNHASSNRSSSKMGFNSESEASKERRRVFQYHFTCWHDYKAPECVALLRLIGKLRKLDDYNNTPVIVHCSAGVGRTGTLIAIDYLMDQCHEEGKADVFKCVSEMRQQRNLMVQSVEQYAFIYKALAEYQLFGNTDLSDQEFRSYYTRLRLPLSAPGVFGPGLGAQRERHYSVGSTRSSARSNSIIGAQSLADRSSACTSASKSGESAVSSRTSGGMLLSNTAAISAGIKAKLKLVRNGAAGVSAIVNNVNGVTPSPLGMTLLEAEFNNLSISLEKPRATDWAQKPENVSRNRDPLAVPYDGNRVVLSHFSGYDSTYINASTIKGYFYPYIMAQDPLDADGAFDFWRMIHDQNAHTLVQLSADETFMRAEKFWPPSGRDGAQLTLGRHAELVVTLLGSEENRANFAIRRLNYRFTNEKDSKGREVLQYIYRHWKPPLDVSSFGVPTSQFSTENQKTSSTAIPRNVGAFLELACAVLERHSYAPDAGPIVLHCRDGSARNGVFCAVSLLLERLKSEQMIDVFRTAKGLKLQRAKLFNAMEEYAFCFDSVMEFIGSASSVSSVSRPYRFE